MSNRQQKRPKCVWCCKNTNSEDKVTCLACKHASSAHISTTNIFFLSDRDSGTGQKNKLCLGEEVQVAQPSSTSE